MLKIMNLIKLIIKILTYSSCMKMESENHGKALTDRNQIVIHYKKLFIRVWNWTEEHGSIRIYN